MSTIKCAPVFCYFFKAGPDGFSICVMYMHFRKMGMKTLGNAKY